MKSFFLSIRTSERPEKGGIPFSSIETHEGVGDAE